MKNAKFFIYARKSTDDSTRQARSIGDQIAEARELARREGFNVLETLVEKQTAKKPGRPIFNEMLDRIEKGEASGIIAWHPDRLARNSLDGGKVIWMIDTGAIEALKFPSYRFDPTPQGKLGLAIEFGISKYYVDKLSADISRGIRQKVQNGIWPQFAPVGYLNDRKTKIIIPDPVKAPLIRKAFEMYATGNYTLRQVRTAINDLGLTSKYNAGKVAVSKFQYFLQNPIYYGMIRFHGEFYAGKHEPIISKELFDAAQAVMSEKSKPKSNNLKPYLYRGQFHCGACGRLITTERQKGHNYLRCTKWENNCPQPYVREEKISEQVTNALRRVALPAEWADWMLGQLETEKAAEIQAAESRVQAIKDEIRIVEGHLDRLMTAYIEQVLNLAEYGEAKNKRMEEKHELEQKLASIEEHPSSIFEPIKTFISEAKQAGIAAESGTDEQKRDFFKKTSSNPNLFNRELRFEPRGAWKVVVNSRFPNPNETLAPASGASVVESCDENSLKRRGGDSNPRDGLIRQQHFQCCAFSHSATSPTRTSIGRKLPFRRKDGGASCPCGD